MLQIQNFTGEGSSSPVRLRALSLAAGVKSTTMALMAAHGEIGPIPDCAILPIRVGSRKPSTSTLNG